MGNRITFLRGIFHQGIITDQQIFKDVCLIPCMLNKKYGFEVSIAGYELNEELLHSEFSNVKFINIKKTGNYSDDVFKFLYENAKNIDILYLFGGYKSNLLIAQGYKVVNPNGKIYLKLDMNRFWLSKIEKEDYFGELLKISDLVTVEDKDLQVRINNRFRYEVEYLRNGYYDFGLDKKLPDLEKENIILTAGRLGTQQKATNMLIEAFLKADLPDWQLRLAGEVDESFLSRIDEYKKNPKFNEQVKFLGVIKDKKVLNIEYRKAKVFAMTSIFEASAHVYAEAAINGCYIISTDVDGISDIKKYSTIIDVNNVDGLAMAFEDAAEKPQIIRELSEKLQEYTENECSWDTLVGKLYLLFCIKGMI